MIYQKTHEGRAALRERNALNLRERQLMVLVNGSRTLDELADLFGVGVLADVDNLSRRGFVVIFLFFFVFIFINPGIVTARAITGESENTEDYAAQFFSNSHPGPARKQR